MYKTKDILPLSVCVSVVSTPYNMDAGLQQRDEVRARAWQTVGDHRRVLGNDHPYTIASVNNMGLLLQDQGKFAEAEPLLREALEASRRALGNDHPDTIISVNNMAMLLNTQGKLAETMPLLLEALIKSKRVLGNDHPDTISSVNNMAMFLKVNAVY